MLVNVVNDPTGQGFLNHMYGTPSQETLNYFHQENARFRKEVSAYVDSSYLQRIDSYNNMMVSKEAIDIGKRVIRNSIHTAIAPARPLYTIEDFRTAPKPMIAGIMTNPYLHEQYKRGAIDGFSEYYTPEDPRLKLEQTHAYRVVHDGLVRPTNETGGVKVDIFNEQLAEGEVELDAVQRTYIIESGMIAATLHREFGIDVTDTFVFD